jgi:outer membrane protein OmpA-like peptidoglycan-associated protein
MQRFFEWPPRSSNRSSSSATPTARGPYTYNLDLSRRRAEAIADELVKNYHIGAPRLRTAGVAHLAPVGSNASEAGRALNRRVELVAP